MEEVNKYGQMAVCMRVIGEMIRQMAEEDSFTQMEMFMKVIGRMIKPMVRVNISIQMELSTKDIGKKTNNTGMEKKLGQIMLVIRENTRKVERMGKGSSSGQMAQPMMETL